MTTSSSNSALVMDVDFESEGDGTVTVWAGKTVTSTKSDVTITAWDVVMDGSLTAGTLSISVHGAKTSQTIGIGASLSQNMEILDGELGRLTAEAGLTIGTAVTGEIQVKGVTDGSSDSVGTITLVAMKDGTAVAFLGTASAFNKGIVVQAMGGVVLSESVTTKNWPTLIYAGTGTLKTRANKSLVSTNQLLTVTADDVDLQGDLVDSGTAAMVITPLTSGNTIGLGDITSTDMDAGKAELAVVTTSGGLTIGSLAVSGSITVVGVISANSNSITGAATLLSSIDDSSITFSSTSSSFHTLAAQADNAVAVLASVSDTIWRTCTWMVTSRTLAAQMQRMMCSLLIQSE